MDFFRHSPNFIAFDFLAKRRDFARTIFCYIRDGIGFIACLSFRLTLNIFRLLDQSNKLEFRADIGRCCIFISDGGGTAGSEAQTNFSFFWKLFGRLDGEFDRIWSSNLCLASA